MKPFIQNDDKLNNLHCKCYYNIDDIKQFKDDIKSSKKNKNLDKKTSFKTQKSILKFMKDIVLNIERQGKSKIDLALMFEGDIPEPKG